MAQVERYRIVLTGWVISGFKTQDVVADLCLLFRMPKDRVRGLLMGDPSIIRRDLIFERAVRLRNKIEQRGAVCNLQLVMRDATADYQSEMEATGILEPDLSMEQTQVIPIEQASQLVALQPVVSEPERAESNPGRWGKIAAVVLASALILALAWGYLGPHQNGHSSNLIPKVYTFAPAKGAVSGGGAVGSVRQ
ncbi:MAG: hypothetical protein GY753_14775 [Gammaproteobacteria bacterium]|nr:hypothetical protein [Gammaproteobacteria bacterium]